MSKNTGIEPSVVSAYQKLETADCADRKDFIDRFDNDTRYYFHQQYTADEKKRLAEMKQMDITIDRVRPIIRRVVSKIVRTRPMIAALTIDNSAKDLSRMINAQAQYAMRISKGLAQIRKGVMNAARGGMGFWQVYKDHITSDGMPEVKFRYISPKKVYVDPAAEDLLFDDARSIQILEKVMLYDALRMFHEKSQREMIIGDANTSYTDQRIVSEYNEQGSIVVGSAIDGFQDLFEIDQEQLNGHVELLTTYTKKAVPVYYLEAQDENENVIRIEVEKSELHQYRSRKDLKVGMGFKPVVQQHICTPFHTLEETDLEWAEESPITPCIWEDTENPYPISETFFIRGHQKLGNAFWRTVLANAQASSFPNIFAEENTFVDPDEAKKSIGTPNGIVMLRQGSLSKKKIEKTYASPLNQAYFTLLQFVQHEQEYQASTPAIQQGDPSNAPETNKALVNMDNFADRALAINIDAIELSIERVFRNLIRWQAAIYEDDKLLLIDTDPQNNAIYNETQAEVDDDGRIKSSRKNVDFDLVKYDVALVPGSMSPLDKTSEFQYAREAVNLGAPPEFAIKRMPITGVAEVIEDMDTIQKLQQQLQQASEVIEQMQSQMEGLADQLDKSEKETI